MNKIKKIFITIKEFLNSIFNKSKVKMLEEKSNVTDNAAPLDNKQIENIEIDSLLNETEKEEIGLNDFIYTETDKKDFFRVYNNIKNGIVKLEDLMIDDLIKVQLMMKSELDIIDRRIDTTEEELKFLNTEINSYNK